MMAPWLGALADKGSAHLRFLAVVHRHRRHSDRVAGVRRARPMAVTAAMLFAIASIGFWGGLIFYDSMLMRVAPPGRVDSVSGFGYALGYLGGGLLLVVNVVMYAKPALFGLAEPGAGDPGFVRHGRGVVAAVRDSAAAAARSIARAGPSIGLATRSARRIRGAAAHVSRGAQVSAR